MIHIDTSSINSFNRKPEACDFRSRPKAHASGLRLNGASAPHGGGSA